MSPSNAIDGEFIPAVKKIRGRKVGTKIRTSTKGDLLTTCKKHGEIYDPAWARVTYERRQTRLKGRPPHKYYRCLYCLKEKNKQHSEKQKLTRKDQQKIRDDVLKRTKDVTGWNPELDKVQKKVVNMFLNFRSKMK